MASKRMDSVACIDFRTQFVFLMSFVDLERYIMLVCLMCFFVSGMLIFTAGRLICAGGGGWTWVSAYARTAFDGRD